MTERELIRMTDDAATGSVDTAIMTQMVTAGEAEAEGYLAQRYTVKSSLSASDKTDALVLGRMVDLVVYRLFERRNAVDELLRLRYEDAIKWLKDVAAGKTGLPGWSEKGASPSPAGKVIISSTDRVLGRSNCAGL